jgi:hypothetical protein
LEETGKITLLDAIGVDSLPHCRVLVTGALVLTSGLQLRSAACGERLYRSYRQFGLLLVCGEFDSVQIDCTIAYHSAARKRLIGLGGGVFNSDLISRRQICEREQVNAAFAQANAPALDDPRIGEYADGGIQPMTFPTPPFWSLPDQLHSEGSHLEPAGDWPVLG